MCEAKVITSSLKQPPLRTNSFMILQAHIASTFPAVIQMSDVLSPTFQQTQTTYLGKKFPSEGGGHTSTVANAFNLS